MCFQHADGARRQEIKCLAEPDIVDNGDIEGAARGDVAHRGFKIGVPPFVEVVIWTLLGLQPHAMMRIDDVHFVPLPAQRFHDGLVVATMPMLLKGEEDEGDVEPSILEQPGHLVGPTPMPGIERPGGEGRYDERREGQLAGAGFRRHSWSSCGCDNPMDY